MRVIVCVNLVNRRPVGDEEALKIQFTFQHVGEQMFLAVHFFAIPTVVGNHDGADAGLNVRDVGREKFFEQRGLVTNGVALVNAICSAAIADEMFRARENRSGFGGKFFALQTNRRRNAEFGDKFRVVGIAFVGAAPAFVLRDGNARRERPADAGAGNFSGGHAFGALDELGVVRRAEGDVMREDRCAINVVMAVDGINAVKQGNLQPRLQRLRLKTIGKIQPVLRRVAAGGIGRAAAQDGAEKIFFNVSLVFQRAGIHLHHLADFFVERHLREQGVGFGVVFGK